MTQSSATRASSSNTAQLTATGRESRIDFRHHDVDGNVMHEWGAKRAVG